MYTVHQELLYSAMTRNCIELKAIGNHSTMIRRSILLLLSIIVALIPSLLGTTTLSIENVSACLKSKIAGKKYRKAKEKAFFLNYGEYGAEAFNVFSNSDIKEIELLSECVVEENLTYFFPR